NDLSSFDLKMVENCVNGFLNENGISYIRDLHNKVITRRYSIPCFHGVKNFIQDQEGYVYYKGVQVEHYSFDDYKEEGLALLELDACCKKLESYGIIPDSITAVWWYGKFEELEREGNFEFDLFL